LKFQAVAKFTDKQTGAKYGIQERRTQGSTDPTLYIPMFCAVPGPSVLWFFPNESNASHSLFCLVFFACFLFVCFGFGSAGGDASCL